MISINKTVEEIIIKPNGEVVVVEQIQTIQTVEQTVTLPDPENPEGTLEETSNVATVLSSGYNRRYIKPGDSTLEEEIRVKEVCALVHSEEFLGHPVVQDNGEKWETFNEFMFLDPAYNSYTEAVAAISLYLPAYVSDAYSLVAKNGVGSFRPLFNTFCALGEVTTEHREAWAAKAEELELPASFVSVIRGN